MPDRTSDSQVLTLAHPMLLGKACPVSPSTKIDPVWLRPRGASEDSLAPFSTWGQPNSCSCFICAILQSGADPLPFLLAPPMGREPTKLRGS